MTLVTACPKPPAVSKFDKAVEKLLKRRAWGRSRKPLKRSPMKRGTTPLARSPLKASRTPIRQVNTERQAKRLKHYRKVLASDFHKRLRYQAWERSGGLCECERCRVIRLEIGTLGHVAPGRPWTAEQVRAAYTITPVWFTKKGGEAWQRFRSTDGEVHHDSYALFGDENPDELRLVRWTWDMHHHEIEAKHHTRRRYLRGTR